MTIINKIAAIITNRGFTNIFIMICFILWLNYSQEAYAEMKKVTGTSKELSTLLEVETNKLQENVRFINKLAEWSSTDSTWDKAKIYTVYFYINPTRKGDDYMGSFAVTDPNGDQAFIQYDGSWKFDSPSDGIHWTAEAKGAFIGGTGKFKGIRGAYESRTKGSGLNSLGTEWEINYEIVSSNN